MARRRGEKLESSELPESGIPAAEISFTQQILSANNSSSVADRWLFDTGADIDATNKRQNLRPGTIVELRSKQFPIRTGSVFPLNIVSGERFYRRDGYLEKNRIVSPNGEVLSYINTERRGFFLWLYNQDEPLKLTTPRRTVNHTSIDSGREENADSSNKLDEIRDFQISFQACQKEGVFAMSDDFLKRLVLWHRRLCHPGLERLRWTIRNTTGIDLDEANLQRLPCEACDMGKSLKYTTNDSQPRMKNVGEGWHCDVGTLNPTSIEGHGYFCLTTEDVSHYRIFRALKKKSEAADELKFILSKANIELRQRHGLRVRRLTIDGGRDWGLTTLREFAADQEIDVMISAPKNQYQNGVSEGGICFVQDTARCCTIQIKVPSVFSNCVLEITCYTLNLTSQSSAAGHKTPWKVPGTLCITHVDASHRITGEKLDVTGTRSVFFGYRGRKNKLVWLLDGGRFLVSPHVTAYESVHPGAGWAADPREIVRSLPKHVQDRLKSRKTDYARNEDYNMPYDHEPPQIVAKGRGRLKRTICRPYEDQCISALEAPVEVDDEIFQSAQGETTDGQKIVTVDFTDAVTGRNFGDLVTNPTTVFNMPAFSMIRKAINQQNRLHSDGDEIFRILVNDPDIPPYILTSSADEPTVNEALKGPEKDE
ncbi:hypothetical protein K3495_g6923 [Podosphaera aphanis]|nr:hypothetical protein K3495_g6923 [Podosphaera aphanis]